MTFRFFAFIQSAAELVIAANQVLVVRPSRAIQTWASAKATHANLQSCNERQVARTRFS